MNDAYPLPVVFWPLPPSVAAWPFSFFESFDVLSRCRRFLILLLDRCQYSVFKVQTCSCRSSLRISFSSILPGDKGIRTLDPLLARQVLSQLSYTPIYRSVKTCKFESGSHLLSHAVSSIVPSAAWVLTIVFGMGTGVSPKRIATGSIKLCVCPMVMRQMKHRFY